MTTFDDSQLSIHMPSDNALARVGQVANDHAARNVFADYLSRKADNTIRRQAADLARFAEFLDDVGSRSGLDLGAALPDLPARLPHSRMVRHLMATRGAA